MPGSGQASWLWVLASIAIFTVGELYLLPVGLSFVTKVAPARHAVDADGRVARDEFHRRFFGGFIGSFWSGMAKPEFFLMIAAISALAGIMIFICRWPLKGTVRE